MIYSSRNLTATPGSDVYAWFPKGGPCYTPGLPPGWGFFSPAIAATNSLWHNQWAWGIRVPADAQPAGYSIPFLLNGQPATEAPLSVTVLPKPAIRPLAVIPRGQSLLLTQSRLNDGFDVELEPGVHEWSAQLNVPPGASIRGHGAVIVRHPNGDYAQRMFVPQGGMTIDGLTLTHDASIDPSAILYLHAWPRVAGNVTVRRCTMKGGHLGGATQSGMLVEQCRFERAGTGEMDAYSVWLENLFTGQTRQGLHAMFDTGAGPKLICSNRFDQCTRGMVFQTGDCCGNVVIDNYFRGIRGGAGNANECILLEGGNNGDVVPSPDHGMRDNAFVGVFIDDCAGPGISLYGSGMHDNIFWDINSHVDSGSVLVSAIRGGKIGANTFMNVEAGDSLELRGDVGGQYFANFHFLANSCRRGNAGPFAAVYQQRVTNHPIYADDIAKTKTYSFSGCGYVGRRTYEPVAGIGFKPALVW